MTLQETLNAIEETALQRGFTKTDAFIISGIGYALTGLRDDYKTSYAHGAFQLSYQYHPHAAGTLAGQTMNALLHLRDLRKAGFPLHQSISNLSARDLAWAITLWRKPAAISESLESTEFARWLPKAEKFLTEVNRSRQIDQPPSLPSLRTASPAPSWLWWALGAGGLAGLLYWRYR